MASRTELLRERTWRTCKGSSPQDLDGLLYFLERFVYIQHPEQGSILFALRPAQKEILETWVTERYSIVLKARQVGWSTLVANYALWLAFFWPDNLILMLSKGDREAMKLLQKATYAYDRLPPWLKERGPKRMDKNVKKLTFANASAIESLPSKEDPGRSSTASLVIVDEWAFLENAEEAWASIEPIADVGGRVIGLSTANGSGDFFHRFWISATTGATDFKPMFFPWHANDERDDAWYETKKRTMLEWQLHREYPNTPEEAFIKSGNPVFDVDALDQLPVAPPVRGRLDILRRGVTSPEFEPEPEGSLRIWEFPHPQGAYVIGADVAEGLEHGDYSCAYVISIRTARVVACWHGHIPPDLFAERLTELGHFYNQALVGVEVNNHGLTTCTVLQRTMRYPRVYFRKTLDQRTKKPLQQIGWHTNKASKPLMIDELARTLREELILEDEHCVGELKTYVRDEKGAMHGSPYDDRVMSLAIANQMRAHQTYLSPSKTEDDYLSFNYHMRRVLANAGAEREGDPLGWHNRRHNEAEW